MKDKEFYTCDYCFKEFEPKRRRVQKYCSDTCRSKAHHERTSLKKKSLSSRGEEIKVPQVSSLSPKVKVEVLSAAGVGNATLGTLAADGLKSVFTSNDNKPATKGDLKKLIEKLEYRYHLVNNLPRKLDGSVPYYDLDSGMIVYLNE